MLAPRGEGHRPSSSSVPPHLDPFLPLSSRAKERRFCCIALFPPLSNRLCDPPSHPIPWNSDTLPEPVPVPGCPHPAAFANSWPPALPRIPEVVALVPIFLLLRHNNVAASNKALPLPLALLYATNDG